MKTTTYGFLAAFAGAILFTASAQSAEIARGFELTNRETGRKIRLSDYEGKVVFLDFFAYWCPPCVASSPSVERDIAQYYKARNGNPHGVEVEVIGVNVEPDNDAATDDFIASAGLKTVGDDPMDATGAWAQFGNGSIPHFVIISGVDGGNYQKWEVLESASGFSGAKYYRDIIDTVKPRSKDGLPEIKVQQPLGRDLVDDASTKTFGKRRVGNASQWKKFSIKNAGKGDLTDLGNLEARFGAQEFHRQATGGLHAGSWREDHVQGPVQAHHVGPAQRQTQGAEQRRG